MPFETHRQKKERKKEEKQFPPVPRNYYEILGISPDATESEIKSARKKLARKLHPDLPENQGKDQDMAEINNAADVLSNPERRKFYDQELRSSGTPESPITSEAENQRLNRLARDLMDLEYKYVHTSVEKLSGEKQHKPEEFFTSIIKILQEIAQIRRLRGVEFSQFISRNLNSIREKRNQRIKELQRIELKKVQDRLVELKRLLLNSQQSLQQTDTVLDRVLNRAYRKQLDQEIKAYKEEIEVLEDNERYLAEITKS